MTRGCVTSASGTRRAPAREHEEARPLLSSRQAHPRKDGITPAYHGARAGNTYTWRSTITRASPTARSSRVKSAKGSARPSSSARSRLVSRSGGSWSSACSPTTPRPTTRTSGVTNLRRARDRASLHASLLAVDERQGGGAGSRHCSGSGPIAFSLPDERPPRPERSPRLPQVVQPTTTARLARSPTPPVSRVSQVCGQYSYRSPDRFEEEMITKEPQTAVAVSSWGVNRNGVTPTLPLRRPCRSVTESCAHGSTAPSRRRQTRCR